MSNVVSAESPSLGGCLAFLWPLYPVARCLCSRSTRHKHLNRIAAYSNLQALDWNQTQTVVRLVGMLTNFSLLVWDDFWAMQILIFSLGSGRAWEGWQENTKSLHAEESSKGFSQGGVQVAVSCYQTAERQPKTQRLVGESKAEKGSRCENRITC